MFAATRPAHPQNGYIRLEKAQRAAPTHPDAAEQLQGVLHRQFLPVFREAFPDIADIDQRAALVLSQTIGMAYCRYIMRLEPFASLTREGIKDAISGAIRLHLGHGGPDS